MSNNISIIKFSYLFNSHNKNNNILNKKKTKLLNYYNKYFNNYHNNLKNYNNFLSYYRKNIHLILNFFILQKKK